MSENNDLYIDPIACLKLILEAFDGSGHPLTNKQNVALNVAREQLVNYAEPAHHVWLNTADGKFSNSWDNSAEGSVCNVANLVSYRSQLSTEEGAPWKLIEYRCLTDSEFRFYPLMRLR